jgi:hypothetical protein
MTAIAAAPVLSQQPTERHAPYQGRGVEIIAYGAQSGDHAIRGDWNDPSSFAHIATLALGLGIREVIAPNPGRFNALILNPRQVSELRTFSIGDVTFRSGCYADGCVIPQGSALFLPTGDCHVATIYDPESGLLAAGHAGRDSNFDRRYVEYGVGNKDKSVVGSIIRAVGGRADRLLMGTWVGIGKWNFPHPVDHPIHGKRNEALRKFLRRRCGDNGGFDGAYLDMEMLLWLEARRFGIRRRNMSHDESDTYGNRTMSSDTKWHSHRRQNDPDAGEPKQNQDARNGLLIWNRD